MRKSRDKYFDKKTKKDICWYYILLMVNKKVMSIMCLDEDEIGKTLST